MTETDIAAIEARAKAATPGPWTQSPEEDEVFAENFGQIARYDRARAAFYLVADASFISHARQDVPDLIAEVRRLREDNERLRAMVAGAADIIGGTTAALRRVGVRK